MEITISQFRREIFAVVNQALAGDDVWVTHKGRRLKIVPEDQPTSRLGRLTPMKVLRSDNTDINNRALKDKMLAEMKAAWKKDWSDL
jgi:antitoxin (DNA-binding transcriptional repressor) of toxin-antitoxin stability system